VLVVVVLLLLLGNIRAGLIVALAIPLSMLAAMTAMFHTGLSGNLMSLGAIDFGLIVDGAVVMGENIIRRRAETPDRPPAEVIREAAHEVARPVVFAVAIIAVVNLPLLSLRGVEGRMEQTAGQPYLRVILDREAVARYGLNAAQVLDLVEAMGGRTVGTLVEGNARFDIRARLAAEDRSDIERIGQLRVVRGDGMAVPLSQLAEIRMEGGRRRSAASGGGARSRWRRMSAAATWPASWRMRRPRSARASPCRRATAWFGPGNSRTCRRRRPGW